MSSCLHLQDDYNLLTNQITNNTLVAQQMIIRFNLGCSDSIQVVSGCDTWSHASFTVP
jgi:hypothetical protein